MGTIKTYRSGIVALLMALPLLLWGCKKDSSSGPDEPDPVNKELSASVSGPSMVEVPADVTYNFSASDEDGLTGEGMIEITAPDGSVETIDWSYSGDSADTSITRNFTEQGSGKAQLTAFGNNPETNGRETQTAETNTQYALAIEDRIFTLNAGYPGIDVQFNADFNEQQYTAQTNEQGIANITFSAPQDSLVNYIVAADAAGLHKQETQGQSDTTVTLEMALEKVPFTFTTTLPGQYPGEVKTHELLNFVTLDDPEQGSVPVEFTGFTYSGANFELTNDGSVYTFTPTKNETGVIENFTLSVAGPFENLAQETLTKEIFAPRSITIDVLPDGKENSDLVLQEFDANYVQSEATIDSVNVSTTDANITVTRDGDTFTITPNEGFFGNATITAYARNIDGAEKNEQRSVYFEALPRANITAINSVTNQAIESYLLFRDETAAVIDSVVSSTGQFEVAIPQDAVGLAVAEQVNGVVKSFEHYVLIDPTQPITRTIPVEDFREYDLNRNYIADMSLFDMKRFKYLMEIIHGQTPVINLDGNREGSGFSGVLHRAVESTNGIGYNELIIPDTTDWVLFDETGIMESGTPDLIENEYLTKIAPVMESFAMPVQRDERITYDHNNKQPDVAYINPRLLPDSFGSNAVMGKLPHINKQSLAQILQDGERKVLSETTKKRTALQELTSGNIYFTGLPADFGGSDGIPTEYQLGPEESIIHNSTTRLDLSVFDRKAGWMIYEPYNLPGEKIDHILSIPNQIKAEYDAL